MEKTNKTYIITFGTGRCGTKSMAHILNSCKNTDVAHEWISFWKRKRISKFLLPWKFDFDSINERIEYLKSLDSEFVGDVGFYYLNYISYLDKNLYPLKLIYLYRDKKEHLQSQFRVTAKCKTRGECCHWLPHNHSEFIKNNYCKSGYDNSLPQFPDAKDKADSINKYWDYYMKRAEELKKDYSHMLFFLETKNINNKEYRKKLFDFLEMPEEYRYYTETKK